MNQSIKKSQRIVVKIGTSSLIYANGSVNLASIDQLAFSLSALQKEGREVILVTSGAIGVGLDKLNLKKRPASIPEQQAIAALGQATLMNIYSQRFSSYNQETAQVLLTRDIIDYPVSRENVTNTIEQLIKMDIIPIINENDTVSVEEMDHQTKFGDNDKLSAIVAGLADADLLIMLSDIDGFYSANPLENPDAKLYRQVQEINDDLMERAGAAGSRFGTGGMASKLKAAKLILANNQSMILANGSDPRIILDIVAGEEIGTLFSKVNDGRDND